MALIGRQRILEQKSLGKVAITSGGVIRLGISERMINGLQAMDLIQISRLEMLDLRKIKVFWN